VTEHIPDVVQYVVMLITSGFIKMTIAHIRAAQINILDDTRVQLFNDEKIIGVTADMQNLGGYLIWICEEVPEHG
jgi:hypothetical protein